MSLEIPITGIPQDLRRPGAFAEILYAQGPGNAFAPGRVPVLVMPKLASGNWPVNTLQRIRNARDAEQGAGPGSPLHRAVLQYLKINKNSELFAVPYAALTGGDTVQATAVLSIATTSTGPGTIEVWVAGELVSFGFPTGATATVIGEGIENAINDRAHLPVTANNSTGTVTLTAKAGGASQGTASLGAIRVHVRITAGVATTASFGGAFLGTGTAGSDGSASEATLFAAALAVLDSIRKYYVVTSLQDATNLAALVSHIQNKSAPKSGLRSVGIASTQDTLSNAITLATARNYERLQIVWMPKAELDPCQMAATMAAVRQLGESVDTATNFDGYSLSNYVPPQFEAADYPDGDDINDALNGGLCAIESMNGITSVSMSVTTRSKNSAGTQDDFRAAETHRISVTDEFADEELAEFALNFAGKKIADDQLLADGITVNPNQKVIRNVIRPSAFKGHIRQRLDKFEELGKLKNVDASKASLRVIKTLGRFEVGCDLDVIDHLHQATYRLAEVSEG